MRGNRTSRAGWCAGLALGTAACMPMEQAPLVYSSSHQIGAQVDAATPNNPGLAVSLGYKGLDAAYVPVAVAKACTTRVNCEHDIYKQIPIQGSSNEGDDPAQLIALQGATARVTSLTVQHQEALARYDALSKRRNDNNAARQRLAALQQEETRLKALLAAAVAPAVPAAQDVEQLRAVQAEIKAIGAPEPEATTLVQMKAQEAVVETVAADLNEAKDQQAKMEESISKRRKDVKGDAFSVYGRFDGSTRGEAAGAGLSLGKVFSTGIAAQNLTQGIREAATSRSRTECLQATEAAAATIVDPVRKQAMRDSALDCAK